ncbi:hypothetical protein IV102_23620 [bacterium]|nr:hypothetical protein [bacterium]
MLASTLLFSRYQLESGWWLIHFKQPPGNSPPDPATWLSLVQRLCRVQHPNLATFVEAFQHDREAFVVMEDPRSSGLRDHCRRVKPDAHHLLHWASQLAEVGSHLQDLGFPVGPALVQWEHLGLRDGQLVVTDPGLTELLWQGQQAMDAATSLHGFGDFLRELSGAELPANLEWIALRCQSTSANGYGDFGELAQAFHQALSLVVDVPETSRSLAKKGLPVLHDFQVPWLARAGGLPWHRLGLLIAVLALMYGGLYAWWTHPLPPRNFSAAVVASGRRLLVVDLKSGVVKRQLELNSPALHTLLAGDRLWVACQGTRRLLSFHSRTLQPGPAPMMDADPSQMVASPDGAWIYLLYPQHARVLLVKLPNNPTAYLDVMPGTHCISPLSDRLLVVTRGDLRLYSLRQRLCLRNQSVSGIVQLTVDQDGACWVAREGRVEQWNDQLHLQQTFDLPAPSQEMMALETGLVSAVPGGLAVLRGARIRNIRLEGSEPHAMRPDPLSRDRVWLLQGETLVCVDLVQERVVQRWPMPNISQTLSILP